MNSLKRKNSVPFTQVKNNVLNSSLLTFKAKGLYAYMLSKPENWKFTLKLIESQTFEKIDSIRAGMSELKKLNLVEYKKNADGTGEYIINHDPILEEPELENPNLDNPNMGKPNRISNKESISNKEKSNNKKYIKKENPFSLKRDTHFDNVSNEYKQKLKAKLLLLCGSEKMIENYFLSLEAKASYKYKNFVTVFKRWHKDLNYTPLPEPQLGKGWFRVSTNGKFYAINEKTLEIKIGSVKETSLQDQEPKQIQKRDLGFLKNTVRRF